MPSEPAFVPATILGVHATNDSPVVLLHDSDKSIDRTLVIFIDYSQAHVIRAGLLHEPVARPLTHDLLLSVLEHLGAKIERVVIEDMAQSTFYASLYVKIGDESKRFDARPSDCLALAVRCGAPLEVARKLMKDAGVPDREIRYRDDEAEGEGEREGEGPAAFEPPSPAPSRSPAQRVEVENVLMTSIGPQVFLADPDHQDMVLTIPVEPTQALNIQLALEGQLSPRPMTHDLFSQVLNELGAIVEKVVIEDLHKQTFYASLHVQMEGGRTTRFDARPSDCLALAVRVGAPIEVAEHVLKEASIPRSAIGPAPVETDDDDADLGVER